METVTIKTIEKRMLGLALLVSLGILAFLSKKAALSFAFGAGLSFLNFRFLSRGVRTLLSKQPQSGVEGEAPSGFAGGGGDASPRNRSFTVLAVLKYPLLLALVGFVILKTPIQVEAFVAGLLSLVAAILWEGLVPKKSLVSLGE